MSGTCTACILRTIYVAGDLAKKKIYPALFALYYEGMLPENFSIFGFARSKMTDNEFREYIQGSLSCRLTNKEECGDKMADFLKRCFYQPGQYKEQNDFKKLSDRMSEIEGVGDLSLSRTNRQL